MPGHADCRNRREAAEERDGSEFSAYRHASESWHPQTSADHVLLTGPLLIVR